MTASQQRRIAIVTEKITKKQIDQTLADGKTHVKFKNKGINRRMLKAQEKIRRQQELRENQTKQYNKAVEAAKGTRPVGTSVDHHFPAELVAVKGSARFIDKDGKHIPVATEVAAELAKGFEAVDEEIDRADLITDDNLPAAGFKTVSPFEGMGIIASTDGADVSGKLFKLGADADMQMLDATNVEEGGILLDSVLAEHLDTSGINPFDIRELPAGSTLIYSSEEDPISVIGPEYRALQACSKKDWLDK